MNVDLDFLIGLAAVHVGLIHPGELPIGESDSIEPLLATRCSTGVLTDLRDQAAALTRDKAWDLSHVVAALSAFMVERELGSTEAKTLRGPARTTFNESTDAPSVSTEAPGRYQFAREHACGGMGRVLLVYDEFLARRIALKELLPQHEGISGGSTLDAREPTTDPATRQQQARFLYEARITGQLEHPSIVPVYELGKREDGTLYYTMRLVKGRSLRKAIREAATLEGRLRLLPHFIDLCQAIAFAHSRNVIHRDIKPGNVMVGGFGETVVIDWGLAKATNESDIFSRQGVAEEDINALQVSTAVAMGTPAYMPPEQATGDVNEVDERSDVYSLGAVLYELLTGIAPYPDETPANALAKLLAGAPAPISDAVPGAPEQLTAICGHAMARNPKDRYQTAKELSTDIERFLSGRLVDVYNYRLRELFAHFVRRFKAPLIVGIIGVFALSCTVFLSYQQIQTERDWAIAAQHRAEHEFYFAAITVAHKYIADGDYEKAMIQLDRCPPQFRHWEWGYLLYLCNRDQRTLRNHEPETAWSVIYMPDGVHMASSGFDNTARIWSADTGALLNTYTSPHGAVIEISPHPNLPLIFCAKE
ncbi:MAG: serine/threonine-protein kinase, partial [Candidatus Hydrogenedentes bacterium]|nr:serine/threonine-protein kinase [Candidatus Hydrogenedentota bacterium]